MHCPPRRLLRLAILSLLALTLAGCARSTGRLSVDLTALKECRKLTPRLQVSAIESGSDYRALAAEAGGTIQKGNKAIARRNRCDDKVIGSYAAAT
jgi:uncharacterized protein YerC